MHFSWVVEFPMFDYDDEEKRWVAMHHPFTSPRDQDFALLATDPGKCRAKAYDLVINGNEAGGGTIRIHDPRFSSRCSPAGHRREVGQGAVRLPAATRCSTAPRRTAASPWASTAA